jgi:hypothetical protein
MPASATNHRNHDAAVARAAEAILAYGFGRPQSSVKIEKVTDGAGERIRVLDVIARTHPEILRDLVRQHRLGPAATPTIDLPEVEEMGPKQ